MPRNTLPTIRGKARTKKIRELAGLPPKKRTTKEKVGHAKKMVKKFKGREIPFTGGKGKAGVTGKQVRSKIKVGARRLLGTAAKKVQSTKLGKALKKRLKK